jgi:hypothetical protein
VVLQQLPKGLGPLVVSKIVGYYGMLEVAARRKS